MPIHPNTQAQMAQLERRVLDILERDGGRPVGEHSQELLVQVGRHLGGLFSTLKQLDARLEKRTWDALAAYFAKRADPLPKAAPAPAVKDPVVKESGGKRYRRK
jgi:hypothetical protein